MAGRKSDVGALVAAGAIGLGLAAIIASGSSSDDKRRSDFLDRLRTSLQQRGCHLIEATPGRGVGNAPFWDLAIQRPTAQVMLLRHELNWGDDPYSDYTLSRLESRLAVLLGPA